MKILFCMEKIKKSELKNRRGTKQFVEDLDSNRIEWEWLDAQELTKVSEAHTAEKEEKSGRKFLVITDSPRVADQLNREKICCIGYQGEEQQDFFPGVKMVLYSLEGIDTEFVINIWKRYYGLPVTIAESERLIIRESIPGDFDALFHISREKGNDQYTETMSADYELEKEKFQAYIEHQYSYYGAGLWTVLEKISGEIIARCGLSPHFDERTDKMRMELGYLISRKKRGQGYAYEACSEILRYAFKELECSEVYAYIQRENVGSRKLAERLGLKRIGDLGESRDEELWSMDGFHCEVQ